VVLLVFLASRAATNSVRDAVTNSFPSEFPGYPGDFPTDFPTDFGDGPEVNDPLEPLFLHSPAEFTEDGPPTELDVAQARSLLPGPRGRAATRRDVVDHSLEWTLTGDQGYDASLVIIATSWESRDAAAAFAHAIADDCAAQGYDRKQLGPPTSGLRCRRGGGDSTYYWVTAHGRISAFYALHDPRPTPAKVAALTRFLEIQVAAM
jgi:hypothetical protein